MSTLPAVGIIVAEGFSHRQEAASQARFEALALAHGASYEHRQAIRNARQLLSALSQVPAITGQQPRACADLLREVLEFSEQYANLGLLSLGGNLVCSAMPYSGRLNFSDRLYFRRVLESRDFAVGDYVVGRVTGQPSLVFAHPVFDEAEQLAGVVYAALPLTWLRQRLERESLPRGATVTVTDPMQQVLARFPDSERWIGRSLADSRLGQVLGSATAPVTTEIQDGAGTRYLYAIVPLNAGPTRQLAHLSVGIPVAEAFHRANANLAFYLSLAAAALAMVLTIAWWGGEAFVLRPLRALRAAVARVEEGDLAARAPLQGGGKEIDGLASAFNRMAASVQQRDEELSRNVAQIARLNRIYAALSGINGAILRLSDRCALLEEACRIAREFGGFPAAIAATVSEDTGAIQVAAYAGEPEFAQALGSAAGNFGAAALGEGRDLVCNRIDADTQLPVPREAALARGYRSCAALLLSAAGRQRGALEFYSEKPDFFDEDAMRLLRELAADAALGLDYIERESRVQFLSFFDGVTGLPNRALFEDRLAQALARARHHDRTVTVMALDIARFRELNDTLGRHAGDHVLNTLGRAINEGLREGDTVGRIGSHHFGVVLADMARADDVADVASGLLERLPRTVAVGAGEVFLDLRAGAAIFPRDATEAPVLTNYAELAMRSRRGPGGSRLAFYSAEMDEQVRARLVLEAELRSAVAGEEFALHYQPVVDLVSGRSKGVEALLRWTNPRLGPIGPGQFVPVAEETGLIVPIGEWVLREACRQAAAWKSRGFGRLRVAVNVSARQLGHPDFLPRTRAILYEEGYDPASLSLAAEVTESELMENLQVAMDILGELRALGISVAIDDFGTGYSSLSYLKQLPVDTLKIDISFVRDLAVNQNALAVARSVIALGHSLGLRVVAEGVETPAQRAILLEMGCDEGQGYLFARPAPAADIEPFLHGSASA